MNLSGNLWPQELPGSHTVCIKTNVEIQILYLECQWKPHKSIIFLWYDLNKYYRFWHKMCAQVASTKLTEYPELRNQRGTIGYPISVICYKFICICSAGVITSGGNHSKVYFMVQILHRNPYEMKPSQKQIN